MKWTSPQCATAVGSLIAGFALIFLDFFYPPTGIIHEGALFVLGQSFLYAGGIFGIKGYVDGKIIKFKNDITNGTKNK